MRPNLLSYRDEFDSLKNCHYLISNSLGAMPNAARQAALKYVDIWQQRGVRSWEEEWWQLAGVVGNKLSKFLNAPLDSISMHQNVTSAQAVVQSCFNLEKNRNKIVMVDKEFPSLLYLYRAWLEGHGNLEVISCPDPVAIPLDKLLDAIDEQTLLVPISHVLFRSSYIVDVEAIVRRAHEVGALVMLDIYQSIGVVPVDLREMDVDFAVGGCLKWLCGGPGACFLYVNPDLNPKLKPRYTGWCAHETPFAFDNGSIVYTNGAYRFQNGTPPIPGLYTCQPGLEIVSKIGVNVIRKRSTEMTGRIIEHADKNGWPITAVRENNLRAGTVALNIPGAETIMKELVSRNFLVDYRPKSGIRISPHFYNSDEEIDNLLSEIEALLAG